MHGTYHHLVDAEGVNIPLQFKQLDVVGFLVVYFILFNEGS